MNTPPDLLSLFAAQIKEWWPYVNNFFTSIWSFLAENKEWIELGFLLASAVFLFGIVIFFKRAKEEFESYRGFTFRDVLGFSSKRPVEYLEEWRKVKKNLSSGTGERMKQAVIEARHLFDNLLHESLYKGRTFRERIESFADAVNFRKKNELLDAEETAKKLEGREEEEIAYKEASGIIEVYEEAINEIYEVKI